MPELWDGLMKWFSDVSKARDEAEFQSDVAALAQYQTHDHVTEQIAIMRRKYPTDVRIDTLESAALDRVSKNKDLGIYGGIANALFEGFNVISGEIGAATGEALKAGLAGGNAVTGAISKEALDGVFDAMFAFAERGGSSLPEELKTRIKDAIRPLIEIGLTWEIATDLAELIHPTKELGLGGVSHFLHDTIGFSTWTGAIINPLQRATTGVPMELAINQLLRPYVPDLGILADMTRGHHLSEDKYATAIARHGIMQPYADTMVEEVWTQPGLRNLLIISQYARPDPVPDDEGREFLQQGGLSQYIGADWYLAEKLAKSGYKNRDIAFLLKALKERTIGSIVANIYSIRKSQFAAGKIDRTEYESFLEGRGFSADEVKEALDAITADLDATDRNQLAALYEKKFLNGRMTEADLRVALKNLEKTDKYVDTRVKLLTEQKLGKLTAVEDSKILSRADYQKQYADGIISRTQFVNALDVFGYSLSDATAIADLVDHDTLDDVRVEIFRAAEESAKNNRLSLTDLELVYQNNGKSKDWSHARRDYIEQTILGKLTVTVTTSTADTLKAEQAERIRAAEQEAKNERLSKEELITVYLSNGKTQAWADARAAYIGEIISGKSATSGSV